jgi:hypothetical protein
MKKLSISFLFISLLCSCLPDEPTFEAFRRVEVQRLLSNNESKRWLLKERILFGQPVNLETCEIPSHLVFNFSSSNEDQDSVFYINASPNCEPSSDTIRGFWFVPATLTPQTPTDTVVLVWQGNDTAFFQVDKLNPENLGISSYFPEDSLSETFTYFPIPPAEEE